MLTRSVAFKEIYNWKKVIQFDICFYESMHKMPRKVGKFSQMRGQLIDQFFLLFFLCFLWFYCLFNPPTKPCVLQTYTFPFQSIARNLGLILNWLFSLNLRSNLSVSHVTFICQTYHQSIHFSQHLITTTLFQAPSSISWIAAITSKWIFLLLLLTTNNSLSTKKLLVMTHSCYDKETPKYSGFNKIYLYFSFM